MKNFTTLLFAFFALVTFPSSAQTGTENDPNINNDSPNTETAFLSNDFKYQQSGYERVDGGRINVQPGVWGKMTFKLETGYDYVFIGVADANTEGMAIAGKPVNFEGDLFVSDTAFIYTEYGSRLTVYPLPESMLGNVEIRQKILGDKAPKEATYYLLMRKKSSY